MEKAETVEEYVANAPQEYQPKLKQLRRLILEVTPDALEKLSYGMPYYGYKGRYAYFAYAKSHVGLYIPPPVIQNNAEKLKKYSTAMATIRFPWDEELPVNLIKKLLKERKQLNEDK